MPFRGKGERSVKCQDCGFLAIRHPDTRELVSPAVTYRYEGFQGIPPHVWPDPQPVPNCFVRAHPIHAEPMVVDGEVRIRMVGEAPGDFSIGNGNDDTENAILSVIGKHRFCKEFYSYIDGFSPKEHYEERERRRRRKSNRRWRLFELMAFTIAGVVTAIITVLIQRALSDPGNPPMP